ncbi:MAG: Flp pilus assembly protein CpaB [Acidimicrobiia bacterium]
MGNRRTLIAAAAIVLAAAAGFAVFFYVSGADQRAEDQVELVEAFVAAQDIPKGMSGDAALAEGLITADRVLRGSVPAAAVKDSGLLSGKVAASTIQAKQFITEQSFVQPSEGGGGSLASSIGSGDKVAVTISVDPERGVANAIAPGDRVDVLVVDNTGATAILEAVKVLAVGQETAASAGGTDGQPSPTAATSGLITFELRPDEALAVVSANKNGTLYLTLRPLAASGGDRSVSASGR